MTKNTINLEDPYTFKVRSRVIDSVVNSMEITIPENFKKQDDIKLILSEKKLGTINNNSYNHRKIEEKLESISSLLKSYLKDKKLSIYEVNMLLTFISDDICQIFKIRNISKKDRTDFFTSIFNVIINNIDIEYKIFKIKIPSSVIKAIIKLMFRRFLGKIQK